ncbi:hypothetical protein JQ582_33085 [Bradyrhizobium japonicum]|nr:hypothetical protein [Bradyrhizobium japonicum]
MLPDARCPAGPIRRQNILLLKLRDVLLNRFDRAAAFGRRPLESGISVAPSRLVATETPHSIDEDRHDVFLEPRITLENSAPIFLVWRILQAVLLRSILTRLPRLTEQTLLAWTDALSCYWKSYHSEKYDKKLREKMEEWTAHFHLDRPTPLTALRPGSVLTYSECGAAQAGVSVSFR